MKRRTRKEDPSTLRAIMRKVLRRSPLPGIDRLNDHALETFEEGHAHVVYA